MICISSTSFYESDEPKWYKNKEPKPHPGLDKGLRLVLDAHSDQISHGTVSDDFKGFVAVVDDKRNFPLTKRQSFLLKSGRENYVSISAINIKSDEAIRKIDPQKRFCYFAYILSTFFGSKQKCKKRWMSSTL